MTKKRSGCFKFLMFCGVCIGLLIAFPFVYFSIPRPGTVFNVDDFMEVYEKAEPAHPYYNSFAPVSLARLSKSETEEVAKQLRAKFPFESLVERMRYMKHQFKDNATVTDETLNRLKLLEEQNLDWWSSLQRRKLALSQLHSDEVHEFINESGFGIYRMPPPSVFDLKIELPTQPLNPITVRSEFLSAPKIQLSEASYHQPRGPRVLLD